MAFRLSSTYPFLKRIECRPKTHCWPIDHDPILWVPMRALIIRPAWHLHTQMCNSCNESSPPPLMNKIAKSQSNLNLPLRACRSLYDWCFLLWAAILVGKKIAVWKKNHKSTPANVVTEILSNLLQKASQFPFAFTGDKCFASFTMMWSEPFVFFEHVVGPEGEPLLALFADEFDLMLNFLKLRPCEWDEPDESDPGINFSPTMMSPR